MEKPRNWPNQELEIWEILLNIPDDNEFVRVCSVDKRMFEVCRNDYIWHQRLDKYYPEFAKLYPKYKEEFGLTWRDYYVFLSRFIQSVQEERNSISRYSWSKMSNYSIGLGFDNIKLLLLFEELKTDYTNITGKNVLERPMDAKSAAIIKLIKLVRQDKYDEARTHIMRNSHYLDNYVVYEYIPRNKLKKLLDGWGLSFIYSLILKEASEDEKYQYLKDIDAINQFGFGLAVEQGDFDLADRILRETNNLGLSEEKLRQLLTRYLGGSHDTAEKIFDYMILHDIKPDYHAILERKDRYGDRYDILDIYHYTFSYVFDKLRQFAREGVYPTPEDISYIKGHIDDALQVSIDKEARKVRDVKELSYMMEEIEGAYNRLIEWLAKYSTPESG